MPEENQKLTPVIPGSPPFTLQTRYPGWSPDVEIQPFPSSSVNAGVLYPEEMVKVLGGGAGRVAFQPPLIDDPKAPNTKWILGTWLREYDSSGALLKPSKYNEFNTWLFKLSVLARNYNASLYRLRSLHLKNPLKPMRPLPGDTANANTVTNAEGAFQKVTTALTSLLNPGSQSPLANAIVDMIQVNGYIVAFRATAPVVETAEQMAAGMMLEPGGSDSSHISLSSAFSSWVSNPQ